MKRRTWTAMMPCRCEVNKKKVELRPDSRFGLGLPLIRTHVDRPHPDRFRRLGVFFYQLGKP